MEAPFEVLGLGRGNFNVWATRVLKIRRVLPALPGLPPGTGGVVLMESFPWYILRI